MSQLRPPRSPWWRFPGRAGLWSRSSGGSDRGRVVAPGELAPRSFAWAWVLVGVTLLSMGCSVDPPAVDRSGAGVDVAAAEQGGFTPKRVDFTGAVVRLERSVVAVVSTSEVRDDDGRNRVKRGIGAGVVVSSDGQILTNEHVVASASAVHVELPDLSRRPARVIERDPRLDLALLQLDDPPPDLTPVRFRPTPARRGEWVMAVGQPFGLGNTMTAGIVSGLGRDHRELGDPQGLRPDGVWSFIQTDASVNIGNSGGPLADLDGEVVGITTAVRVDGQGLAFAIPVKIVEHFLREVRAHGQVRHTRLGVRARQVDGEAARGRSRAVLITAVDDDGAGARAGLRVDDLVLAVDGESITRVSELAYRALVADDELGLVLTVLGSDGRTRELPLIPDRRP